jgi:hypothetical protein
MIIKGNKTILLKGEKKIKVKATSKRKAHYRIIKTSNKVKKFRLENQLNFFENSIRNQDYETLGAYDENGNIILQKDGEKDRISITKEEGLKLKGSFFTHNHPKGFSFSPADILCACQNEMKEMRCISKADGSKYSMSMKDGSNFNRKLWDDKIEAVYLDADSQVRSQFTSAMYNNEMTIQQCNDAHWNYVWGLVSELCPELEYKVIK